MLEPAVQFGLAVQLVFAALLGAAIGAEREVHGHPAGIRTHLLVALGSALFTVISTHGFAPLSGASAGGPIDPSRVAAQIVTGIGFLGAGAIIKEGFSVRGLTTAASLWVTAAVGMAAGVGEYLLAGIATVVVLVSLWPLSRIAERLRERGAGPTELKVRFESPASLETLDAVEAIVTGAGGEVLGLDLTRQADGTRVATFELRLGPGADIVSLGHRIAEVPSVVGIRTERQE